MENKKRIGIALILLVIINFCIIFFSIQSGIEKNDVMLRFREQETVTFLSALALGIISFISLITYLLKKRIPQIQERYSFWLYSAIGFFYLSIDEYFMAHEGMDEWVGSWFGKNIKEMNLDGIVIAFFGLIALLICIYFRKAILKHKVMVPFLILGGFFLLGTVACHMLERTHIYIEVAEESSKIVGVSMFFAAYFLGLLSFLDRISINYKNEA